MPSIPLPTPNTPAKKVLYYLICAFAFCMSAWAIYETVKQLWE